MFEADLLGGLLFYCIKAVHAWRIKHFAEMSSRSGPDERIFVILGKFCYIGTGSRHALTPKLYHLPQPAKIQRFLLQGAIPEPLRGKFYLFPILSRALRRGTGSQHHQYPKNKKGTPVPFLLINRRGKPF